MATQATIKNAAVVLLGVVLFGATLTIVEANPLESNNTLNDTTYPTTATTATIHNVTSSTENSTSNEITEIGSSRKARILNFDDFRSISTNDTTASKKNDNLAIQGRILTGENSRLYQDNSFQNLETVMTSSDHEKSSADIITQVYSQPSQATVYGDITPAHLDTSLKTISVQSSIPNVEFGSASYSYASPTATGLGSYDGDSFGVQPSDILPYYYDHHSSAAHHPSSYKATKPAPLYTLVPVHQKPPTLKDAMVDALFKVKNSFSGTVQKVKNAFGWNNFAEKVSSPDTLLAVAPVAAGILAGGLAAAYFSSKASRNGNGLNTTNHGILGKIFGKKRSIRGVNEEDLMHVVANLDPLQRQYLEQLQFFGPRRWRDPNCAKMIFCDVMSRAGPLQLLDAQRRIGSFLSRLEERSARYVEGMIKDVMLGIAARDCSRFSCAEPPRPGMFGPPRPPTPPQSLLPGNNFLRKLRIAAGV